MMVASADFKRADAKEIEKAKGDWKWKTINVPWDIFMKTWGSLDAKWKGGNPLRWAVPLPLQWAHNIKLWTNYAPEREFIRSYPTFRGVRHFIDGCPAVLEAFLKQNRNGELFSHSMGFDTMLGLIKKTFKESTFTNNDFIITAGEEENQVYHKALVRLLNGTKLKDSRPFMKQKSKEFLDSWSDRTSRGESINITVETRNYASQIAAYLAFDRLDKGDEAIGAAVNFVNTYIVNQSFGKLTNEHEIKLNEHLEIFKKNVNLIVNSQRPVPLFEGYDPELTVPQKQAMVFGFLFAAQEGVAILLLCMLVKLAKDLDLQHRLQTQLGQHDKDEDQTRLESIQNLFVRTIREYPPAYGISRRAKVDICLEFFLHDEFTPRKFYIYAGDFITPLLINFAKANPQEEKSYHAWTPFAEGSKQRCPGESFAQAEILEFAVELLKNFHITVPQDYQPKIIGVVTLQLEKEVLATVSKRVGKTAVEIIG